LNINRGKSESQGLNEKGKQLEAVFNRIASKIGTASAALKESFASLTAVKAGFESALIGQLAKSRDAWIGKIKDQISVAELLEKSIAVQTEPKTENEKVSPTTSPEVKEPAPRK